MKKTNIIRIIGTLASVLLIAACASNDNDADLQSNAPATTDDTAHQGKISLDRNFYFVFDGSGSMQETPKDESNDIHSRTSKIEGAKWAVHEFLKKVPENVNLGLYVFDNKGNREVLPLGANNRAQFLEAIDDVQAGGQTPLGRAIRRGANALARQYKKQLGYGEYRLIVITDGDATDTLSDGVNVAEKRKIPIYTIGFDMSQDHELRSHSVSYRSADSASEVEQALEQAGAELDIFDPTAFPNKGSETAKQN